MGRINSVTETELIDAVNELVSLDTSFRSRFQRAVATKDLSQIRSLIAGAARKIDQDITETAIDRVVTWFAT